MDTLTVCTSATPRGKLNKNCGYAKSHVEQNSGNLPFPAMNLHKEIRVKNIHELSMILSDMENDPQSCVIRGKIKEDIPNPCRRRNENFIDHPRYWVCFDFDSIPGDLTPPEVVQLCLPEEFHNASFHWQYSGSHGFKPGTRLHVWFWMDRKIDCKQWREWVNSHGGLHE